MMKEVGKTTTLFILIAMDEPHLNSNTLIVVDR